MVPSRRPLLSASPSPSPPLRPLTPPPSHAPAIRSFPRTARRLPRLRRRLLSASPSPSPPLRPHAVGGLEPALVALAPSPSPSTIRRRPAPSPSPSVGSKRSCKPLGGLTPSLSPSP
ncbi:hypothetical protein PAHAL_6G152200 [Panicum hallii]|uniref:Uncharacterized protein n=1 Tax=Panicum hallii TaxID=206008 RepID=A0A2T8IGA1_9POAL|nr:hypothetical protein PAHAL_6G152200 [Panicum hallii]